ncbi:hypothetical protein FVER14953_20039 [Fusarium verticillioides]|nr:hypothetical protein FVER14953_20039 [Fusarium verticillioides]
MLYPVRPKPGLEKYRQAADEHATSAFSRRRPVALAYHANIAAGSQFSAFTPMVMVQRQKETCPWVKIP